MAQFNIGTPMVEAIKELRGNPHFDRFMSALGQMAQLRMLAAMETQPEMRVDATAHARMLYDLWSSMASVHQDVHPSQVRPGELPLVTQPAGNGAETRRGRQA